MSYDVQQFSNMACAPTARRSSEITGFSNDLCFPKVSPAFENSPFRTMMVFRADVKMRRLPPASMSTAA
jgi:hypothetical protein